MDRDRSRDAEEDDSTPPEADAAHAWQKLIVRYAMIGFAPAVSVAALIAGMVAISSTQSQTDRVKLDELTSRIGSLNATLSETRSELENLKFMLAREKTAHGEEIRKLEEREAKIIQSVTRLQAKLKVSPTLEEQLRTAASSPVIAYFPAGAVSAPAVVPVSPGGKQTQAVTSEEAALKKPVATSSKPKAAENTAEQVKALRDAIEKFNRQ